MPPWAAAARCVVAMLDSSLSGLLREQAHMRKARSRFLRCCRGATVVTIGRPGRPARSGYDLQIRSSGQVVQDRPSLAVRWADFPESSVRVGRCLAAGQQYWQQSPGTLSAHDVYRGKREPISTWLQLA
jgi:hypothetical protein